MLDILDRHAAVVGLFAGHLHMNKIWRRRGAWHIWTAAVDSHPCSWRCVTFDAGTMTVDTRYVDLTGRMKRDARAGLSRQVQELQRGGSADLRLVVNLDQYF